MKPALARGMTVQSDLTAPAEIRRWYAFCAACLWESAPQDKFESAYLIADSPLSHPCKRPARRGRV